MMFRSKKRAIIATAFLCGCSLNVSAQSNEAEADTDATSAQGNLSLTYSLPNAYYANFGGHSALSDYTTLAEQTDFSLESDEALISDLSEDSLSLDGQSASYYLNASNLSSGTLSTDRLVGSLFASDKILFRALLSGTYDISITGNSATSTYSDAAGEAEFCTGGPTGCDY